MPNPWHFVIVNGYGTRLNPEFNAYPNEYLDRVVSFVEKVHPAYLIFCGAETQKKTARGVTEAAFMLRHFLRRRSSVYPPVPEILLEENSYTSLENVVHAVRRILSVPDIQSHWAEVEVDVFCEAQRALQVQILYWIGMPELRKRHHRVWVHTSSWELDNPIYRLRNIIYDVAAIWIPGLGPYARWRRIARSKTI